MRFDEKTTTQLAAYFLKKRGGIMSYMKLIKLLYFADREHIRRTGCSITKDVYFSMKHGPVLSNVFDLITLDRDPKDPTYWENYISEPLPDWKVEIEKDPGNSLLSKNMTEIADKLFEEFGRKSRWEVRNAAHELPENKHLEEGREKITFQAIARALGFSQDKIDELEEESETIQTLHSG